jgi:hypothetical protein
MNITTEGFFESTITMQQSTSSQIIDGTAIAKYEAQFGTDKLAIGKIPSVCVKQHAITYMKEYRGKSIEELRLEDYKAGRLPPNFEKELKKAKKKIEFLRQKYNQSKQELQELQDQLIIKSELLKNYEKLKDIDGDIDLEFPDGKTLKAHKAVLIGKFD